MQRKSISLRNKLMVACAFLAACVMAAPAAMAHGYHNGNRDADMLGALVVGAVIGGVLVSASNHHDRYYQGGGYYPAPAYPSNYYSGGGYGYPAYAAGGYSGYPYGYGNSVNVGVVYGNRSGRYYPSRGYSHRQGYNRSYNRGSYHGSGDRNHRSHGSYYGH